MPPSSKRGSLKWQTYAVDRVLTSGHSHDYGEGGGGCVAVGKASGSGDFCCFFTIYYSVEDFIGIEKVKVPIRNQRRLLFLQKTFPFAIFLRFRM